VLYFLGVVSLRTCSVDVLSGSGRVASWEDEAPRLFLRGGVAHGRT
jgi:hypothetical protein